MVGEIGIFTWNQIFFGKFISLRGMSCTPLKMERIKTLIWDVWKKWIVWHTEFLLRKYQRYKILNTYCFIYLTRLLSYMPGSLHIFVTSFFVKATKIPKIGCEIFISMCFVFACLALLSKKSKLRNIFVTSFFVKATKIPKIGSEIFISMCSVFAFCKARPGLLYCLMKKFSFRPQIWRCVQLFCNMTTAKVWLY